MKPTIGRNVNYQDKETKRIFCGRIVHLHASGRVALMVDIITGDGQYWSNWTPLYIAEVDCSGTKPEPGKWHWPKVVP